MINIQRILFTVMISGTVLLGTSNAWSQFKLTRQLSGTTQSPGVTTIRASSAQDAPSADKLPDPTVVREIDFIVAIVNEEPVTRNEVLAKQARLLKEWVAGGVRPPPRSELFKLVLERTIEERAVRLASRDAGMRVNEAQVTDALQSVARQNQLPSLRALQDQYEAQGGNWQSYRDEIRHELILLQAKEREVDSKIRVSEVEIDAALAEQTVVTMANVDINLAQILIALPDTPSAAQLQAATDKARAAIARLKAGEDFAKVAQAASDAADKAVGGVMGMKPVGRYPDLFARATQTLQPGQWTDPIQSGAGLHILQLLARESSSHALVKQTHTRHILLPISQDLTQAQAITRLNALKNQIELKQASFSVIAKDHSTDSSASQGGDLGWASPGMFVPEFEKAMNSLAVGEISKPIVSRFGVHLIEVIERRDVQLSQRDRRAAAQEQLWGKKSAEAYAQWLSGMRQRAYVEYRNLAAWQ